MKNKSIIKTIIIVLIVLFCPIAILMGAAVLMIPALLIGVVVYFWFVGEGNARQRETQNMIDTNFSRTEKNTAGIVLSNTEEYWIYFYIHEYAHACDTRTYWNGENPFDEVIKEIKKYVKPKYVDVFIMYFERCKEQAQKEQGKGWEIRLWHVKEKAIKIWYEKGKQYTQEVKDKSRNAFYDKFIKQSETKK